jgi:hypothetical protein
MSETPAPRRTGQSIGAVLAGIFPPVGQQPPMSDSLFLLATAYRIVYGVAGSYIIARLAPDRPMQHALVGGAFGLVASIVGAVGTWNHEPPLGPVGIPSRSPLPPCRAPGWAANSA